MNVLCLGAGLREPQWPGTAPRVFSAPGLAAPSGIAAGWRRLRNWTAAWLAVATEEKR